MPPRRTVPSDPPSPESSSAAPPLRRLRQIAELARTVSGQLDLDAVLAQLRVAMQSLRPDARCSIRLVDAAAGGYRLASDGGDLEGRAALIPFGEGLTDVVATQRRPLLVADTRTERPTGSTASFVEGGFTAYYGAPIATGDRLFGVLNMNLPTGALPTEEERDIIDLLADQAAIALSNVDRHRGAELVARELRDRSAILEQAQAMAQIGYWVSEYDGGGALHWSTGTHRIFGLEQGMFDGRSESFFAMVHPEDVEAVRRASGAAQAGNAPYRLDHRIVWRDGTVRWVHQQAEVQRDPQGRPLRMLGVVQDITDHKEVEEILRDRVTETRQTAEQLRNLIHSSAVAINVLDLEGRILMWNPAAERLFGWRADEVLGGPSPHITEEQRMLVKRVLDQVQRGAVVEPYEAQRVRKDGSPIDVAVYPAPLRDAQGRLTGLMGVLVDVTERNRLDEQLRQAQKMEGIGLLAGGIAHDFNNLLTVILGRTALMLGRLEADDRSRRDVQLIQKTAERAATLTRQLLAFSRKQVLQPAVVNLNAVVADLEPMLHRLIGEDVAIATRLAVTLDQVKVDRGQIEQVIVNLVVNARDAMPDGGRLTVETANATLDESYARDYATAPGAYVMLAVSDTGVGMSADVQRRLFEPFFTTKGPGKGTGLGLATVYGIVKQSGGNIGVYSELGIGTTFRVYLPRVDGAVPAPHAPDGPALPGPGSETLLLVEDEASLRDLAREVLESFGYAVIEAAGPEEALERSRAHPGAIHLLVTDVVMPQMNGRQLAAVLGEERPEMRVLYMSGYTDDAIVRHGVLDARTPFLAKPFTPEGLGRKVREVLEAPSP